ncbi:YcjF family protein, partial [Synechococcus sp. BA-120 BA3]|nr:YcjF family protein [Synechococcus sp. BA-120 BA3]
PLARWLAAEGASLRRATPLRRIEALHRHWQADLERLRRQRLVPLQQRTQWIVAAGVFAAPLPSLDLLVLAAANGLMLQEMARLWGCPWSAEQLKAAAVELGKAALLLGVVEWSSQALAAAVRLHGATWLVGGALQALSAAYLTRVVSHAMADVLALSAGVEVPDLERIKREAPLLVARAAEAEKLDWSGFLQQGRSWISQQLAPSPGPSLAPASLPPAV